MKFLNKFFFPTTHYEITESDNDDLPYVPSIVYCAADGTAEVEDLFGNQLAYTCVSGDIIPVQVRKVLSTGTSGTWYGLVGE